MSASYIALSEKATKEGFDWLTWVRGASPSVLPVRWWAVIVLKSLVAPNLPTKMSVSVTCRIDLCSYRSQPDMCSQAPWAALTTWKTCGLTLLTLGRLRLCSSLHPLGVPSFWRDIRGNLLCWVTLPYMHLAWETNSAFVSRSLHGKQGPMASMPPPHKASASLASCSCLSVMRFFWLGHYFIFWDLVWLAKPACQWPSQPRSDALRVWETENCEDALRNPDVSCCLCWLELSAAERARCLFAFEFVLV